MEPHPLKGFNPDTSGQVAWEDGERVFYRGWRPDDDGNRSAVLLVIPAAEHPSRSSLDRLAHEYGLKGELDGAWAARPLDLVRDAGRTVLVLEDAGGEPLDGLLGAPMEVGRFLRMAIGIAVALGKLHQRGLVHKDIKPANVLVNDATGEVRLTGFGIASRLARERQSPHPPETIAGTLAYMAPEQTGRMNRSIDSRSDLYSLGITLYQMLTGSLPFTASDPMEWVHCHIARKPVPPAERLSNVPAALSGIVMKLLAKTAEERYQTAIGLENDLRRCLTQWETQGRIDDFALGERDTPNRLLIPERLYGRTQAIETLLAAFDRVMRSGTPELVLVSGYSGIGKSSVVHELHKVLVPPRGLFAAGKFDQYKRDIPYATLAQAFQSLVRGLLAKSEADLAPWRDALSKALDSNAQLMVDLVPQLEFIIGKQPPVQPLEPQQGRARFQLMLRRFISVFARPDHPLALFLDDLQWLDAATLDLLEDLLIRSDMQNLMLIGAYRDNEVTAAHPLMRKVGDIKTAGGKVAEIALEPLAREDFGRLIVDTFRCELDRAVPLAHLVHEKTGGNPLFANQFIHALAEEGLLTLDHAAARWSWHLRRIQTKGYADNVVDLMVGKLTRLPDETQEVLQQFACLGNVAEITMLSIVLGTSEEQVHEALWPSVRQELVGRLSGAYRFVHDRIQEAAYSLIPEEQRVEMHLRIGRLLVAHTTADKREEAVFDIVNQLNRGAPLITSQDEREQLAELNQLAGKRAKASAAYASALNYFVAGARQLPEDSWERRHELTFELELRRAECEFLTRQPVAAEQRLAALSQRAVSTLERAQVAGLLVDVYYALDQSGRAIAVSLGYLSDLGIDWSPHPTEEQARREYQRVLSQLGNRTIEELSDLPLMTDPVSLATIDVLIKVMPAAFLSDANLALLIISRAVNLSLERGNCDGSCSAYVRLGMHAGARFGDYQAGYRFGRLGYDLIERRGLNRFQARTCLHFGNVILPMAEHVRAGRELLHRAFDDANKVGDLIYAAYYGLHITTNHFFAGDLLAEAQRGAEDGLAFAHNAQFGFAIDIISSQLELIRTLRGLTAGFGSLNDDQFDETRIESRFSENQNLALCEFWYWIRKLQARFFAGDYVAAVEAASRAERLLWISASFLEETEYHFYAALAKAAVSDLVVGDARRAHLGAIALHCKHLQLRAEACPDNFANRAALVGAEIARLEGRVPDAMDLYERAIRSAQANGFVHNEGLANELAARFYAARGFEKIARAYVRDARSCYQRWGADGKVRQLEALHPYLCEPEPVHAAAATITAPIEHLDFATVAKVLQAVSGEMVPEKLIDALMRLAIEHAGAERCLLLLSRGSDLRQEAEATTSGDGIIVRRRDGSAAGVPDSIVHYVTRTREIVILDDASAHPTFSSDRYVRACRARSILCLPLVNESKMTGVLYLENNLISHVFTPNRIAVLRLLALQATISLENTYLYGDLAEREAKIRRLVDANIIGIIIWDLEGRIIECNDAFLQIVGYERKDLTSGNLRWTELTPDEWRAADEQRVVELKAAGVAPIYEKEYFKKDGNRVPVLIGAAIFDGAHDEGVAFVLDLTERKRAEEALRNREEALRRSEAWLTQAQRLSRIGTWVMNGATRRFLYWSDESYRIWGFDPLQGLPTRDDLWGRIHPDDREWVWEEVQEALREQRDFLAEFRILLPDRTVKCLEANSHHEFSSLGALLEVICTCVDVTERKHAQDEHEKLRQLESDLAHMNRLSVMGELAASLAHEIAQPIAAARNNARAAMNFSARSPSDLGEVREALTCVLDDADRATAILDRIRDQIKKIPPRRTCFDLNQAIDELITLARSAIISSRVSVQTRLADELFPVYGDRVQLQQVIMNLILNAVEAMGSVETGARELLISTEQGNAGALVAVCDSGPGIDPRHMERVFTSFYTTKPSGTGMGLSICRSIIDAHGGRLWAEANEPRGAVFQFTLPTAEVRS